MTVEWKCTINCNTSQRHLAVSKALQVGCEPSMKLTEDTNTLTNQHTHTQINDITFFKYLCCGNCVLFVCLPMCCEVYVGVGQIRNSITNTRSHRHTTLALYFAVSMLFSPATSTSSNSNSAATTSLLIKTHRHTN